MAANTDRYTTGDQQVLAHETDGEKKDETAAIQAGIRETRERLGDTVEQIGDRIDPSRLKEQAINELHDATIGRVEDMAHQAAEQIDIARRSIVRTVRDNPVPFAMVGIGLGWLVWGSKSKSTFSSSYADAGDGNTTNGNGYDGDSMSYGEHGSGTRGKVGEIADSVKQSASSFTSRTQEVAGEVSGKAREQARVQTQRVRSAYQTNPLVIGATALALGLVAGLALPATEKEIEMVGDTRDQFVDKAKEVASDAKSKVSEVAGKVFEQAQATAKDAAQQAGLVA